MTARRAVHAAYAAEATPPGPPMVGVWDQWTVLSDRFYSKEGDLSLHDEETCRAFIENFRRTTDDLPCNIDHNKNRVVGTYNALALFIGGACVDFATHDPSVLPPAFEELPGGDDGSPPNDGIYWRRATLTELGLVSGPYQRKVSPEFWMRGKNQFEEDIGPQAVGGAWTNYPFLPGCEKHTEFTKEPAMPKKMTYAERCYTEAGVGKDDDEKQRFAKVNAFWRGKHGAEFAKFEEGAGVGKDDDDEKKFTKVMSYMAGKFGDAEEGEGGAQEMTGPSVSGTSPPEVHGGEASNEQVPGPGQMTGRDGFAKFAKELGLPTDPAAAKAKLQTYAAAAQDLPRLNQQVQALAGEALERKKSELKVEAQEFTRQAWGRGQIRPRANEKHADAQNRIMQLYTQSGKAAAEAALNDPGSYTPPEAMNGPLHFTNERPPQEASRPDEEIIRRAELKMKAAGIEPKTGRGTYDHRLSQFAREVCNEDPALGKRYRNQSKLALLEGLV